MTSRSTLFPLTSRTMTLVIALHAVPVHVWHAYATCQDLVELGLLAAFGFEMALRST